MTLIDLLTLAGSAAVIAFMVGVAAMLGFWDRGKLDEEGARRRIAEAEPAASIAHLAISQNGRAALARLADGRFIALRALGGDVTVRSFASGAFAWRNSQLIARFGDLGFPALHLKLAARPDWIDAQG